MSIYLGIDVGSITVKLSAFADKEHWKQIDKLVAQDKGYKWTNYYLTDRRLFVLDSIRVSGRPREVCRTLIDRVKTDLSDAAVKGLTLTGSGARFVGANLGVKTITEFKAIAEVFKYLYPDVRSVFEIGGENSKYLGLN